MTQVLCPIWRSVETPALYGWNRYTKGRAEEWEERVPRKLHILLIPDQTTRMWVSHSSLDEDDRSFQSNVKRRSGDDADFCLPASVCSSFLAAGREENPCLRPPLRNGGENLQAVWNCWLGLQRLSPSSAQGNVCYLDLRSSYKGEVRKFLHTFSWHLEPKWLVGLLPVYQPAPSYHRCMHMKELMSVKRWIWKHCHRFVHHKDETVII